MSPLLERHLRHPFTSTLTEFGLAGLSPVWSRMAVSGLGSQGCLWPGLAWLSLVWSRHSMRRKESDLTCDRVLTGRLTFKENYTSVGLQCHLVTTVCGAIIWMDLYSLNVI